MDGSPPGDPKGPGDPSKSGGSAKGEAKPTKEQPKDASVAKGEGSGPGGQQVEGEPGKGEPKPDIAELKKGLKDKDEQKRTDAARNLTYLVARSKDRTTRQAARAACTQTALH